MKNLAPEIKGQYDSWKKPGRYDEYWEQRRVSVVSDMLPIGFPRTTKKDLIPDINEWGEENLIGQFAIFTHYSFFASEDDKAMFILRWGA